MIALSTTYLGMGDFEKTVFPKELQFPPPPVCVVLMKECVRGVWRGWMKAGHEEAELALRLSTGICVVLCQPPAGFLRYPLSIQWGKEKLLDSNN